MFQRVGRISQAWSLDAEMETSGYVVRALGSCCHCSMWQRSTEQSWRVRSGLGSKISRMA